MIDEYTGKKIVSPLDLSLANTKNMEPVTTDNGVIILSQTQIDSRCDELKTLIQLVEKGQTP